MSLEQLTGQENGIEQKVDDVFILEKRMGVADFFGDHRETWYKKLSEEGGAKFRRTRLETTDPAVLDAVEDESDLLLLDYTRIDEQNVGNIVAFFEEYPQAKKELLEFLVVPHEEE